SLEIRWVRCQRSHVAKAERSTKAVLERDSRLYAALRARSEERRVGKEGWAWRRQCRYATRRAPRRVCCSTVSAIRRLRSRSVFCCANDCQRRNETRIRPRRVVRSSASSVRCRSLEIRWVRCQRSHVAKAERSTKAVLERDSRLYAALRA